MPATTVHDVASATRATSVTKGPSSGSAYALTSEPASPKSRAKASGSTTRSAPGAVSAARRSRLAAGSRPLAHWWTRTRSCWPLSMPPDCQSRTGAGRTRTHGPRPHRGRLLRGRARRRHGGADGRDRQGERRARRSHAADLRPRRLPRRRRGGRRRPAVRADRASGHLRLRGPAAGRSGRRPAHRRRRAAAPTRPGRACWPSTCRGSRRPRCDACARRRTATTGRSSSTTTAGASWPGCSTRPASPTYAPGWRGSTAWRCTGCSPRCDLAVGAGRRRGGARHRHLDRPARPRTAERSPSLAAAGSVARHWGREPPRLDR